MCFVLGQETEIRDHSYVRGGRLLVAQTLDPPSRILSDRNKLESVQFKYLIRV